MPRSAEIGHYSDLLASLVVSAARATDTASLSALREEITDAFDGIFSLLSHDALRPSAEFVEELIGRLRATDAPSLRSLR